MTMSSRTGTTWRVALASVVLLAAIPARAETAAEKLGWQLAVHSYTFRKFTISDAIDKTAGLGLKYMSISGSVNLGGPKPAKTVELQPAEFESIQKKLTERGIVRLVNMGVVQLPPEEAKSRAVFEFAKQHGIDVLVAEPEAPALDLVERLCKEYNIKVAIHNHPQPSHYWNPETVLAAVKGRSPLMGACADTGHWVRSGLDPIECLKKLEGRIIALHFKDLRAKDPKTVDVPWGTGISDAKGMLKELKRQNFKGAFCVEYENNWDNSVPEIAECVKFFNAACEELAK